MANAKRNGFAAPTLLDLKEYYAKQILGDNDFMILLNLRASEFNALQKDCMNKLIERTTCTGYEVLADGDSLVINGKVLTEPEDVDLAYFQMPRGAPLAKGYIDQVAVHIANLHPTVFVMPYNPTTPPTVNGNDVTLGTFVTHWVLDRLIQMTLQRVQREPDLQDELGIAIYKRINKPALTRGPRPGVGSTQDTRSSRRRNSPYGPSPHRTASTKQLKSL